MAPFASSVLGWYDVQAPVAKGTKKDVDRVLGNLVSNAVKYTPSGGHVLVQLHRVQDEACLEVASLWQISFLVGREHAACERP